MLNVKFPKEFSRTFGGVSEVDVSCDVYRDDSGLAYWIYAEDSAIGKKGDLMFIEYGPSKRLMREIEGSTEQKESVSAPISLGSSLPMGSTPD
jgi:hypothetical protein